MFNKKEAKLQADKVRQITIRDAKKLRGMLGRICTANLQEKGWYACIVNGEKLYFELAS